MTAAATKTSLRDFVFELFQVTCKRTQQLPTTLGLVGQQCCTRLHGAKSLTSFKLCATTSNNMQQHATICNNTQQHATTCNNTQQHATTRNNMQQHATTCNNKQQHTTTCNKVCKRRQHETSTHPFLLFVSCVSYTFFSYFEQLFLWFTQFGNGYHCLNFANFMTQLLFINIYSYHWFSALFTPLPHSKHHIVTISEANNKIATIP